MLYLLAMENDIKQKLFSLIRDSSRFLLPLPQNPNGDVFGSVIAFAEFLKKNGKEVEIVSLQESSETLSFLQGSLEIKNSPELEQNFVISLSTANAKVDEISYHQANEAVEIQVKPKNGRFAPADVSFKTENSNFDLIICLGVQSLDQYGDLYNRNAEAFFNIPKVNIDNHVKNENFGTVNIVEVTSSSVSEIVFELLKDFGTEIGSQMATAMLAGIISSTNSFQNNKTTPNSFLRASELISAGANQQEIIQHLFKTKDLRVLKLWGRAMARLSSIPQVATYYSMLSIQDLQKSGATEKDLPKVLQEFAANVADARLLILGVEKTDGMDFYFSASPNVKLSELVNHFGGEYFSPSSAKATVNGLQLSKADEMVASTVNDLKVRLGL